MRLLAWAAEGYGETKVGAVSRPSDVKSRRYTTRHNENKPAGQRKLAARPPQVHLPDQEKSGISRARPQPRKCPRRERHSESVCVPMPRVHPMIVSTLYLPETAVNALYQCVLSG